MEIWLKIVITIIIIIVLLVVSCPLIRFLYQIWNGQIDVKETIRRWFTRKPTGSEVIAMRDPNKIYQNGKEVGDVTGEVERRSDSVIFHELCNTSQFKLDLPFEYQRETLRITKFGSKINLKLGTPVKENVLTDVVCKKLQ